MLLLGVVVAAVVQAILLINQLICWQHSRNYFQLLINDPVVDEIDPNDGQKLPPSYASLNRRPSPQRLSRIVKDSPNQKELCRIGKPKCRHSIDIKCEKRAPHFSGTCVLVLTTIPITASAAAVPGEPTNILSPPSSPLVASWLQFWISFSEKPSTEPRQTTSTAPLLLLGVHLPLYVLLVALKTVSELLGTVMVDPLKIFWVLTNSTYLGNVPRQSMEKCFGGRLAFNLSLFERGEMSRSV